MDFIGRIRSSLQAKVICLAVLALLVSLGVLGCLNFYTARNLLVDDAKEDLIHRVDGYSQEIGLWFDSRKREVSLLSTNPLVLAGPQPETIAYLAAETKRNPIFSRFWIVDRAGNGVHSTGDKTNIADRDYFKQVMSTGEVVVTDPIISKVDGSIVVSVVAPIRVNNQIVGVFGGTVNMDSLIARFGEIKVGQSGYAYAIRTDGTVIIHSDKNKVLKQNTITDQDIEAKLKQISEKMVQGEKGLGDYVYGGQEKYLAYAPIPGTKWSLGVNVPEKEVTVKLRPLMLSSLVTSIVILLLTCAVCIYGVKRFTQPILRLNAAISEVAQGNLVLVASQARNINEADLSQRDELERMVAHFYGMVAGLQKLVKQIIHSAEQVAASSEELTASADQSSQAVNQVAASISAVAAGAEGQAASIEEATRAISNMSSSIEQVSTHASTVSATAADTAKAAEGGQSAIGAATTQMAHIETAVTESAAVVSKLGDRSQEIGKISDTISGIAGQTNLLALNAAIEAARAGEAGRGFAVVAEEVRKLAEQSGEAAQQIAQIINEIQTDTEKAVVAMNSGTEEVKRGSEVVAAAGSSFQSIVGFIEKVSLQVQDITAAIQQTSSGSQQIVAAAQQIDKISQTTVQKTQNVSAATQEQSASMEEIAASSQALAKMAEDLRSSVAHFKV